MQNIRLKSLADLIYNQQKERIKYQEHDFTVTTGLTKNRIGIEKEN